MTDVGGVPYVGSGSTGDGFGGLIALFAIFALFGGGGFGANGGGAVTNDFLYTNLNTNTQAGFSNLQNDIYQTAIRDGQFAISRDVWAQGVELNNNIVNGNYQTLIGQAGIQNAIDKSTCEIIRNQNALAKEVELREMANENTVLRAKISEDNVVTRMQAMLFPPRYGFAGGYAFGNYAGGLA